MTYAAQIFRVGELSPGSNWETVQQMRFRQAFDLQNMKLDPTIVPIVGFEAMVKEAMDVLGQTRKAPATQAAKPLGPICPELDKTTRQQPRQRIGNNGRRVSRSANYSQNSKLCKVAGVKRSAAVEAVGAENPDSHGGSNGQ